MNKNEINTNLNKHKKVSELKKSLSKVLKKFLPTYAFYS
jgi:hypothetical protein